MNIFLLEGQVELIPPMLDDKRLFAQAKECMQLIYAGLYNDYGISIKHSEHHPETPKRHMIMGYSHASHPCCMWVRQSREAALLTFELGVRCLIEYQRRFPSDEWSELRYKFEQLKPHLNLFPGNPIQYYVLAMGSRPEIIDRVGTKFPTDLRQTVIAYRIYWHSCKLGGKYTKSHAPDWVVDTSKIPIVQCPPQF